MTNEYLTEGGEPNVPELSEAFTRCSPMVTGGLTWLDDTRFCRWNKQSADGKKHDVKGDPKGGAIPFDGASDCRPFTVDDIIQERAAMKSTAFWHAQLMPGVAQEEGGQYAVALLEYLIWRLMYYDLTREVELSAQYEEHYGWTVLAPRWRRELGMRRKGISLAEIAAAGQAVTARAAAGEAVDPMMVQLATLPALVADPALEDQAADLLQAWYERYLDETVPGDLRDAVPRVKPGAARRAVRDLREKGAAEVAVAYLAKNEPEITALKPWDEVFIPPELTTENEIVFQVERLNVTQLRERELTEGYDPKWVKRAETYKGSLSASGLEERSDPVGLRGLLGGTGGWSSGSWPGSAHGLVEVVHAVYRAADGDGVPAVYCTTFHRQIRDGYAKHEEVEGAGSDLPYAAGVREWWCRSITSSRGVPERAHTTQNLIKGLLDSLIDRVSITALPPVNVYESPTGTQYRFGPAVQNYVRQGREPQFMTPPPGGGMAEVANVLAAVNQMKDNSYGLMSEAVPAPRLQMSQAMAVQRFLMTWNKALQQVMALCRRHMADGDFAAVTGAPAGWLDGHRDDDGCFDCSLVFDVRELDSELMMKRIETMNNLALPADTLGTINRGAWAGDMVRAILGPLAARRIVAPVPDASAALRDRAGRDVLLMFAGNEVAPLDKMDPTAASLLGLAREIVTSNPTYLRALTDEALGAVAGPQAGMIAQQLGATRRPDPRFSGLLMKYLENLQFIGVTQPTNRQIGRSGVEPGIENTR